MPEEPMRAAVYRGGGRVVVEQVPVPECGPGEALVRVRACGVCGTDLKKIQHDLVPPPRIFGHETAGVISAVGPDVAGWQVGDRVVVHHHVPCLDCHHCRHADYAQCATYKRTGTTAGFEPAGGGFAAYVKAMDWVVRRGIVLIPDGVSDEEATFVEPVNTCLKAVLRLATAPGDLALVIGQGQIGLLFTQLLRWLGVRVLASDPLPHRRAVAERLGADAAISPTETDVAAEARARTEGRGADSAVVAVPSAAAVLQAMEAVRPGGTVLLFAHTRLGDPVPVDGGAVCMLEKHLIGSYSSDYSLQDQAADLVFSRAINVRQLITHRYALEEIGEALRVAAHPESDSLKVVVTP